MNDETEKKFLIKISEELYEDAFSANSYYLILTQFEKLNEKYNEEINLSPAFYSVTYNSLVTSCFIKLAKLYESSDDVISIGTLLAHCKKNPNLIFNTTETTTINENDTHTKKFHHILSPEEELFYKDEVKRQREFFKSLGKENWDKMRVGIYTTNEELFELYQKRLNSLSKKIKNIRVQRNKVYAHNDKNRILLNEQPWKANPISFSDIQALIDFALDLTIFINCELTGVCHPKESVDIHDLERTLEYVRIGLKKRIKCKIKKVKTNRRKKIKIKTITSFFNYILL